MSSRNHRALQSFTLDSPPASYQTSFFLRHHSQIIFHSFTPDIFAPTIGPQYVLLLYRESFFFIISFTIACSPLRFKSRHPRSFCMVSKRVHIPSTHTQPLCLHRDLLHSQFTVWILHGDMGKISFGLSLYLGLVFSHIVHTKLIFSAYRINIHLWINELMFVYRNVWVSCHLACI